MTTIFSFPSVCGSCTAHTVVIACIKRIDSLYKLFVIVVKKKMTFEEDAADALENGEREARQIGK